MPVRFTTAGDDNGLIILLTNGQLYRFDPNAATKTIGLLNNVSDFTLHSYTLFSRIVNVYAIQSEATLLKISASSGASSVIYSAPANKGLSSVTTDSDGRPAGRNVYLSEFAYDCVPGGFCSKGTTALLRRPLNPSGGTAWDVILAQGGGTHLRSDDKTLYFLNSPDTSSLNATAILSWPTNAPPIAIDIQALKIEVTQAIQSFGQKFPLVSGHPTYVRAYAQLNTDTTGTNEFHVDARLKGTLNGQSLGADLGPVQWAPVKLSSMQSLADMRGDVTLAFLFELPDSWVHADIPNIPELLKLDFTVNYNGDPPETTQANNTVSRTLSVFKRNRPCLMFVPVKTKAPLPDTDFPDWADFLARARAYYPIEEFHAYLPWNSTLLGDNDYLSDGGDPYNFSEQGGDRAALGDLDWLQMFSDIPGSCGGDYHFVGIVNPATKWSFKNGDNQPVSRGGLGRRPGHALLAKIGFVPPQDGEGEGKTVGAGTMAHELGHNYGRAHVRCGHFPSNESAFVFTVYDPCNLYLDLPLDSDAAMVGFNPVKQTAIKPVGTSEIMSYSSPKWVSHDFWTFMLYDADTLLAEQRARAHAAPTVGEVMLLRGTISPNAQPADLVSSGPYLCALGPNGEAGRFEPLYVVPADVAPAAQVAFSLSQAADLSQHLASQADPVSYMLRLRDASGALLSETAVITHEMTEHDIGAHQLDFTQYVPYNPLTRKIQLAFGDTVIVEQLVSPKPPLVTIDGLDVDTAAHKATLRWRASDADGDALESSVLYSADNGATWRALSTGTTARQLAIDLNKLPGGAQARLRVLVSDGVNTGIATSANFAVPSHAPEPLISGLEPGQRLAFGSALQVFGAAFDAEDGSIDGDSLSWTLRGPDVRSYIGDEPLLNDLAPGSYTLSLSAIDANGQSATTRRSFEVLPAVVPDTPQPLVDGYCADKAYGGGLLMRLPADKSNRADLHMSHYGGKLYACFSGLQDGNAILTNRAGLRIDADGSGGATTARGDIGFFIDQDGFLAVLQNSNGELATSATPPIGFDAEIGPTGDGTWSAELAIDESLLGGWNHAARMMASYNVSSYKDKSRPWPGSGQANQPASWAPIYFGTPPVPANRAPVALAGDDRSVAGAGEVYLDGAGSYDPDNSAISFSWTQVAGPPVTLVGADKAVVSFNAGAVGTATVLRFRLLVSDSTLTSAPDEVSVTVLPTRASINDPGAIVYLPILRR
ncbi:MAG: PKD domain-containing protein [Roseiflexaceae bacterium]